MHLHKLTIPGSKGYVPVTKISIDALSATDDKVKGFARVNTTIQVQKMRARTRAV